jgi:hypothetical protein
MRRRDQRTFLVLVLGAIALVLLHLAVGYAEGLVVLVPMVLVALPLAAGRYVGEDALERWRVARAVTRRRWCVAPAPRLRAAARSAARGGVLLATHLSRRPPPALA